MQVPSALVKVPHWVAWWLVHGTGERVRLPNGSLTRDVLNARDKPYKLPINPHTGGLASTRSQLPGARFIRRWRR